MSQSCCNVEISLPAGKWNAAKVGNRKWEGFKTTGDSIPSMLAPTPLIRHDSRPMLFRSDQRSCAIVQMHGSVGDSQAVNNNEKSLVKKQEKH